MRPHTRAPRSALRRRADAVASRAWRASYRVTRRVIFFLELEPHRELNRARAADLVERAQAAALSSSSKRAVQHLRSLSELGGTEVVDRTAKIRMVQNVEHVHPSLEREAACQAELTAQRHIPLGRAESPERVASEIALH